MTVTGRMRHKRAANRCIAWGVALVILGPLVNWLSYSLSETMAQNPSFEGFVSYAGTFLFEIAGLFYTVGIPVGSALVGAGVVLKVLARDEGK